MSRFVILTHDHPVLHWDFMLQAGDALRTWRLEREPLDDRPIAATALPDHRLLYLDYEGPVSGGRGTVIRWDHGVHDDWKESSTTVSVQIRGDRIQGSILLTHTGPADTWVFRLQSNNTDSLKEPRTK